MAQQNRPAQQMVALPPSRLPIVKGVADELGIDALQWRVLVEQVFPNAKSAEAIALALSYCKARGLDVFKRPVHIVPMWSSAAGRMVETVWPGIAEVRTTAVRTGSYAGIDDTTFGPMKEREFTGEREIWEHGRSTGRFERVTAKVEFPEFASVVVYRMVEGQRCPFHAKVYWEEAFASDKGGLPNSMWQKRPRGQLDKCVEAAALRRAFPEELGNTYVAEEMEGRTIDAAPLGTASTDPLNLGIGATSTAPKRSGPPPAPKPPTIEHKPQVEIDFTAHNSKAPATVEDDTFPGDRPAPTNPNARRVESVADQQPFDIVAQARADLAAVEDGDSDGWRAAWEPYQNAQGDVDEKTWDQLVEIGEHHYARTHDRGTPSLSKDWDA